MKFKNKKNKDNDQDDMRTIANMDVPGMPWHSDRKPWQLGTAQNKPEKDKQKIELTKGERKALLKAVFSALLPIILIYVAAFTAIFLFLYFFWLGGPF